MSNSSRVELAKIVRIAPNSLYMRPKLFLGLLVALLQQRVHVVALLRERLGNRLMTDC